MLRESHLAVHSKLLESHFADLVLRESHYFSHPLLLPVSDLELFYLM